MEYKQETLQKYHYSLRIIGGEDPVDSLWKIICPLFGDTRVVQKTGLVKQFKVLKTQVSERNLIGMILFGSNLNDDTDRIVDTYPTLHNTEITLTLKSICNALLNDHMTEDAIKKLCEQFKE